MTRTEHIKWCKQRALEYLPEDPRQALTSMMSDLEKHPETVKLAQNIGLLYIFELQNNNARSARRFIEGFAE